MRILGEIIIVIGILFTLFGIIGITKYKNFYTRLLVSTKIDTVGTITIIIGIAIRHGFSFFSLKILLLMIVWMLINPLASHMVARSAYLSGYQTDTQIKEETHDYSGDHHL